MQVNLSVKLPNSSGETSTKCAEVSAADTANGFFAQMGHILNQSGIRNDVRQEEIPFSSDPGSNSRNTARSGNDGLLQSPQAHPVMKASAQILSGSMSGLFQVPDSGNPHALDMQSLLQTVEGSRGAAPGTVIESSPAPIDEVDQKELQSDFSVPVPMEATVDNPQSVITLDLSAHLAEILQPQNAAVDVPSAKKESRTSGEANPEFSGGALKAANLTGGYSGAHGPLPAGLKSDSNRNPHGKNLRNKDADLYAAIASNESLSPEGSRERRGNAQPSIEGKQQDTAPSGQAAAGNEAVRPTARQDRVHSVQSNSDFPASGNPEIAEATPGRSQWTPGMRERGLTSDASAPENPEANEHIAPTTLLKNARHSAQESIMTEEAASASADPEVMEYAVDSRPASRGKVELRQLDLIPPDSSPADLRSPAQTVLAGGPARSEESAVAASGSSAQSSTSPAPEVVFQLAEQIRIQVRDGKGEIRIRLKPDGLGHLEIRAENTIHGVSARISTDSNAVKSYLDNNLQILQQFLQDQGLKLDRIHVFVQDAFDPQSSSGFSAQFGHAESGPSGGDSQPSAGKSGSSPADPLDDVVPDAASWLALNPNNRFYTVA